jgi:hypothetical protein
MPVAFPAPLPARGAAVALPDGGPGAVTVIQRANSDLRLNPHFHTVFLDGVYSPDREGARKARGAGRGRCGPEVPEGGDNRVQMFHPAAAPTQQETEALVCHASRRILRFLQRRGVITLDLCAVGRQTKASPHYTCAMPPSTARSTPVM